MIPEHVIKWLLSLEGGDFTDHPADSGGPTKWGITEELARLSGWEGSVQELTRERAIEIYDQAFWRPIHGDLVYGLDDQLAMELFEQAVNLGANRAVRHLQRLLNVLNLGGELYNDLTIDGIFGSRTRQALLVYSQHRSLSAIRGGLNALQGAFYVELAERREKDETFVYGWLRRRVTAP